MDTYSYISENGVIREIADIAARTKNAEQDISINEVTLKANRLAGYSESETQIGTWIDGNTIYRRVITNVRFGENVGTWSNTEITIPGAVKLIHAWAYRDTDSYMDSPTWVSFRLMPGGRLMYYMEIGANPRINMVIAEYTKA